MGRKCSGEAQGDADRCRMGWWGQDKGRVASKWAAPPSPTSISRHSASALPCTLYPRSYNLSLRSPWEQESSLSKLEFSAPCCRADLLTPVPLPSAHHSSSLSPLQHALNECNSYESGSVLLSCFIQPRGGFILGVTNLKWSMLWLDELQRHSSGSLQVMSSRCGMRLMVCTFTAICAIYSMSGSSLDAFSCRTVTATFVDCTCWI